jgi:peroxiredoxin Q/BCP
MLDVGTPAPAFHGVDQHGKEQSLDRLIARGPLVLYFYPKDFTPICTQEACIFRDAYEEIRELGAEVVGVSIDGMESHKQFAARYQLPFPLLADPDKHILQAYGALKAFGLFTWRVTFVIDRRGIIRGSFAHQLSARKHLEDVRKALRELGAA